MEEQIKALIEKYEKAEKNSLDAAEGLKALGLDNEAHNYFSVASIYSDMATDLKQLLTTSQGNPERMV